MRILIFFLFLSALAQATLITQISSTNLIEGETSRMDLIFLNSPPSRQPTSNLSIDGVSITLMNNRVQRGSINGKSYFAYSYTISPESTGSFEVPAAEFQSGGQTVASQAFQLNVLPVASLDRVSFLYQNEEIECFSKVFFNKKEFYPGEAAYLEYKIYLPSTLNPQDWGQPKIDTQTNCTAFRFDPPRRNNGISRVKIGGKDYTVGTYTTSFSTLKPGPAVFGPLSNTLTIAPGQVSGIFGYSRRNLAQLDLETPASTFTVLPFPAGKPANFSGAVGDFHIEAEFSKTEDITLNDSITATVSITGVGNIHELQAPVLEDTAHWKVIDVSRVQQGEEERKRLEGSTSFTYILQPQRGAKALPRFTFSHFNPSTKEFYTDTTATTEITVSEPAEVATVVLPKTTEQNENMQDILAPLASVNVDTPSTSALQDLPVWSWQALPFTALLLLLLSTFLQKMKQRAAGSTEDKLKQQELKDLSQCSDAEFLKKAGCYAEKWHPNSPEAARILELRDARCYMPSDSTTVTKTQRSELLSQLKKCVILLITFLAFTSHSLQASAADTAFSAWQKGDHQKALELYLTASEQSPHSADLLYNIGTSYYRLQKPGKAALYFQRALELEPNHHEARKNFEFTQKLQGAIQPKKLTNAQQWINKLPVPTYQQLCFAGLWLLVLALFYLRLQKPKGALFGWSLFAAFIGPVLIIVSLYAWFEHPTRKHDIEGAAAIVLQYTPVLTEPIHADGQELAKKTLINATPSSLCQIIAERGKWSYISLANGTRGWVYTGKVEAISPQ